MRLTQIVISILVLACGRVMAGEAEIERLRTEYPEASRIIIERLAQVRGKGHLTIQLDKQRGSSRGDFDFQVDHGFQKCATAGVGGQIGRPGVIYCWGANLGFTLARDSDKARLSVHARGNDLIDRMHHERAFGRYFCVPYSIERMQPLAAKLVDRRFQDLSAEMVAIDGRKALRLHYHRAPSKPSDDITVDLDPDLGWVILGATIRYSKVPGGISFRARYDPGRLHWPVPLSVEFKDPTLTVTRCEFRTVEFAPTPPEEFTMGFYGLPDMPGTPKPPPRPEADSSDPVAMASAPAAAIRSWWRSPLFLGLIALAAVRLVAGYLLQRVASRTGRADGPGA
jgi:hypothetical protein